MKGWNTKFPKNLKSCRIRNYFYCDRCGEIFLCKSKLKSHERVQHKVPWDECGERGVKCPMKYEIEEECRQQKEKATINLGKYWKQRLDDNMKQSGC